MFSGRDRRVATGDELSDSLDRGTGDDDRASACRRASQSSSVYMRLQYRTTTRIRVEGELSLPVDHSFPDPERNRLTGGIPAPNGRVDAVAFALFREFSW